MDQLKQLIRVVLTEGKLEQETTQVSRAIVDQLKLRLSKTAGFVRAFTFKVEAPDSLDLKNIEVNVKRGRAIHNPIVSGAFHGDPQNLSYNHVKVLIEVPKEWEEFDYALRQFSEMIPELKDILRHEFEHSKQNVDDYAKMTRLKPDDLESVIKYFMAPPEIAAAVSGMYKNAKVRKINLYDIFTDRHHHVLKFAKDAGASDAEARVIADRVFDAWIEYGRNRFPSARI